MFFFSRYWHFFHFFFFFFLHFSFIFRVFLSELPTPTIMLFFKSRSVLSDIDNIPKTFLDDDFQTPGPGTYYRPLVMSSLILDTQWKSPNSYAAYHRRALFFSITTWFCFLFFVRLIFQSCSAFSLRCFSRASGNNQSVAWMTGRVDILLTIFVLSTLFFSIFSNTKSDMGILSFLFLYWHYLPKKQQSFFRCLCRNGNAVEYGNSISKRNILVVCKREKRMCFGSLFLA